MKSYTIKKIEETISYSAPEYMVNLTTTVFWVELYI